VFLNMIVSLLGRVELVVADLALVADEYA